jgi:NADH-quinone oxidoreductase subunit C
MTAAVDVAAFLSGRFPQVSARPSGDCPAFNVPAGQVTEVLRSLRDEAGYDFLADVTAIDWSSAVSPRFTVVWHLASTTMHDTVRLAADCADDAQPSMSSATSLWPGANWHEREAYDMFGVNFAGHPDLRRILMWDGYPHFPLRKDFPLAGIDAALPDAAVAEETGATVKPAPYMGGPFVAKAGGTIETDEPRAKDQSWTEGQEKPGGA